MSKLATTKNSTKFYEIQGKSSKNVMKVSMDCDALRDLVPFVQFK